MLTIAGGIIIAWIVISVIGAFAEMDPDGCFGCLIAIGAIILLILGALVLAIVTNK